MPVISCFGRLEPALDPQVGRPASFAGSKSAKPALHGSVQPKPLNALPDH